MIYILDFHSLFPKVRHLAKVKVTWSIIFIFAEKRDRELDKCVEFSKVVKVNVLGNIVGFQFSSVAQSCPTLRDAMNRSTPGLPVHHQFPEFTQTHVHRVSDAIQLSHPLSSPSPPAPNPSQHQSLPMSQLFT